MPSERELREQLSRFTWEQASRPRPAGRITDGVDWSAVWTDLALYEATPRTVAPSPVYAFSTPYYMWKGKKIHISLARGNSNYVLRGAPPIFIDKKTEGQEGVTVLSLAQRPIVNRSTYNSGRSRIINPYVPVFRYGDNIDNEKYRVYRNRLNAFIRNSFKAFDRRYKSLAPILKDINLLYLGDR